MASSIVIKQRGEPLDSEVGLGTLLRNSQDLSICALAYFDFILVCTMCMLKQHVMNSTGLVTLWDHQQSRLVCR